MADRLEVLARHLAAENAHNLDAIMDSYVEVPRVVLNGRAIEGRERVRSFHERFGFSGAGSFSEVPTGRRFSIAVCTVYRFAEDGMLASEDVYLDRGRLREQLTTVA